MKEVAEFFILLAWVGFLAIAAIAIEKVLERFGIRARPLGEQHGDVAPPLPPEE